MDYIQAEEYISHIQKFAVKNTLEHTKKFLRALKNPGGKSKIIHVAGTNGKGSTCNYLRALLMAQGFHVGMFISPHLVSMCERIIFDGETITQQEFVTCFDTVREQIRTHEGEEDWYHPTYFEFLFLMAMVFFEKKKPDYIILETGMGGRLDATNAIENPVMTIITEIGLDHQQYLGDTKEQIAWEKAGIIKPDVPLVYAKREEKTAEILEIRAKEMHAKAHCVDKTIFNKINISDKGIDFCYNSRYYSYVDITLCTYARYQAENAALALRAYELLCVDAPMDQDVIKRAMESAQWAGRMEQILPGVFVDGAHNEDGIEAFLESVRQMPSAGKRILLFSVVSDKAYEKMIERLTRSKLFTEYIVADIQDKRGMAGVQIGDYFSHASEDDVCVMRSVREALERALSQKRADDVLYIVGSLYLVGEIKACVSLCGDALL